MVMKNFINLFVFRSFSAKLAAMTVVGTVFMAFVAVTVLFIAHAELAAERIEKAHAMVDAVWNIADGFRHAAESGAMTEDEAKARLLAVAGSIWFEGHMNYVFIDNTESGLCLMSGGNPALIGKDVR